MKKLYKKSELRFTLVFIAVYCVAMSLADNLSVNVGISNVFSLPIITVLCLSLLVFLKRNGLLKKYGLCKARVTSSEMLFYIPLIFLLTVNLWYGVSFRFSATETVLYTLTMLGVGFFEELVFRGLLFKAMSKDNFKSAVIVSSITFGFGHIINLFNGSGMDILENILQIVSAIAVGFMFVAIYHKSGSLIVCIITHGLFNSLSAFSDESLITPQKRIFSCAFIVLLSCFYSLYLILSVKKSEDSNVS